MKIADILRPHIAQGVFASEQAREKFERTFLSAGLMAGLDELEQQHPGWGLFFILAEFSFGPRPWAASQLLRLCNDLGFDDANQILDWAASMDKALAGDIVDRIRGVLHPRFPDFGLITEGVQDVQRGIVAAIGDHALTNPPMRQEWDDLEYRPLNMPALIWICQRMPSKFSTWSPEVHDCDDFERIMRGWLSSIGAGNVMLGSASICMYDAADNLLQKHACGLAYLDNQTAVMVEPQSGTLHPVGTTWLAGGAAGAHHSRIFGFRF